jgi:hypothetical protein
VGLLQAYLDDFAVLGKSCHLQYTVFHSPAMSKYNAAE